MNSSKKTIENLYKILRMNLYFKASEDKEATLEEFRKVTKKLDEFDEEDFQEELSKLNYKTETLEEEENRLNDLISVIRQRERLRIELENDFRNVTGGERISDLSELISNSTVLEYQNRLDSIRTYLTTNKDIEATKQDLLQLEVNLDKYEKDKTLYESKNEKNEDELLEEFNKVITDSEYYKNINLGNIDEIELVNPKMLNIKINVLETKNTKDVTKRCVLELEKTGVTGDIKLEYENYVREAELNYYNYKEQEYFLSIYKMVISRELKYPEVFVKREKLKELLLERKNLRNELRIFKTDKLLGLDNLLKEQDEDIQAEKEAVDNINYTNERIKVKEERLIRLEEIVSKPEVLSLLKEFNLISTYDEEEIKEESVDLPSLVEETTVKKEYLANEVKKIEEMPITMNVGLANLKAKSVMHKVGKMLLKDDTSPELESEEIEPTLEEIKVIQNVTGDKIEEAADNLFMTTEEIFKESKEEPEIPKEVIKQPEEIIKVPEMPTEVFPPLEKKEEVPSNMFWKPVTEEVKVEPVMQPVRNLNNNFNSNSLNENIIFPEISTPNVVTNDGFSYDSKIIIEPQFDGNLEPPLYVNDDVSRALKP